MRETWSQIVGNQTALAALISSTIAIVGVLIAACLSIAGIALNNWFHSRRLEREQTHDREQRELERARTLRKDIFLDASAAMVTHLNAVQSFANLSIPLGDSLKLILSAAPIVAKANLVCSQQTAAAIADLAIELGRATHRLGMLRNTTDLSRASFDNEIKTHDGYLAEQRRLFAVSEEMQRMKQATPLEWERMSERLDLIQKLVDEAGRRIEATLHAFKLSNFELVTEMQSQSLKLRDKLRPVVKAVRCDIGYPATDATLDAMFAPVPMPSRADLAASMGVEDEVN